MDQLALAKKYAPRIYFNEKEPFFPKLVGFTVLDQTGISPTTRWELPAGTDTVQYAIEYAIYWDFDINHLYELEHIWVYVGYDGQVVQAESSYHGSHFRALRKDRSNIEDGTHVALFSQPGKHAFSAYLELFYMITDFELTLSPEKAGDMGLLCTPVCRGRWQKTPEIDGLVRRYLRRYAFVPGENYNRYVIPEEIILPWEELDAKIPSLIQDMLVEMRKELDEEEKAKKK